MSGTTLRKVTLDTLSKNLLFQFLKPMEHKEIESSGILYIVATPIGNLGDITFRAIETLKSADLIACEDTRVTGKLLAHYEIGTPKISVHHHTSAQKLEKIVERLTAGESVAYVSDAGTPGVSDPGNQLVAVAREAEITIVPIPGASAVATIASVAGTDMQTFTFLAYPPHKKGRQTFFTRVAETNIPVIYYDSVHRVVKNLELLAQIKPETQVIVGRELTKMFEEIKTGSVEEVIEYFMTNPDKVKGEFVVIVY